MQAGYLKSIRKLGCNLSKTIVIDDVPCTYQDNPENAIPIKTWDNSKKNDKELLDILNLLYKVPLKASDIREELCLFVRNH